MLATNPALSRYRAVQVTTCSPGQLLVMMYDGLLRFLDEAAVAMRAQDFARSGEKISRAHAILEHLNTSLDPSVDAVLADRLRSLYVFCSEQIITANIKKTPELIDETVRVLAPLREAWKTAVAEVAAVAPAR